MPRGSRRHPGQPERFLQVSQTRGAGALLGGEGLGVGTPRGNCGVSQCRCSASRGGGARRADWGPARGRGGPRLGVGRVAMELQPRPEGRGHEAGRHLSPVDAEPASAGSAWSPSTCWVSSEKRDRGELRAGTAAGARPEAGAGSAFVGSSRPGEGAEAPGGRTPPANRSWFLMACMASTAVQGSPKQTSLEIGDQIRLLRAGRGEALR